MNKTPWKKLMNPDYLGAYSLDDGNGKYTDITATIRSIKVENVTGPDGKKEDCAVAYFAEREYKPMILNATNMKVLEKLFKSKYIEDWANHKIQIGVESVKAFGDVVDALRIRKYLPKETGASACAECGGEIVSATMKNGVAATAAQIVAVSQKRYGKALCATCYNKREEPATKQPKAAEVDGANSAD